MLLIATSENNYRRQGLPESEMTFLFKLIRTMGRRLTPDTSDYKKKYNWLMLSRKSITESAW
jgi:hypothetical protein